jgi:hypothetical protein
LQLAALARIRQISLRDDRKIYMLPSGATTASNRKGAHVRNLITIAAAAAAILLSAMPDQARAQNGNGRIYGIGEPGTRQGTMCWKPANNDGFTYYGYWVPCNGAPAPARRLTSYED